MTNRIPRSAVADEAGFKAAVEAFASEHASWTAHMKRVDAGEKDVVEYPAPSAHPLVAQSVSLGAGGSASPDYEIFDDGPTAAEVFAAAKNAAMVRVSQMEEAAVTAIIPPGKRRYFNILAGDIQKKYDAAYRSLASANGLSEVQSGKLAQSHDAIDKQALNSLDDAEREFRVEHHARLDVLEKIMRHGARLHADVEDLTPETISAWTPEPFPTN